MFHIVFLYLYKMKSGLKIWILDDDAEDRALFRLAIEQLKLECDLTIFSDPQIALSALDTCFPNILFFDLQMHPMDGVAFLAHLRRHSKCSAISKIVVYSIVESPAIQKKLLKGGANFYLVKTVNLRELRHSIKYIHDLDMDQLINLSS